MDQLSVILKSKKCQIKMGLRKEAPAAEPVKLRMFQQW